jgi:hypothetical protein
VRVRGAVVVLVVALAGCAQVLGIDDLHGGSGGGSATLSGTVIDVNTQMPLAGVTLTLHRDSGAVVPGLDAQTTVAGGAFSFAPVPVTVPFDGYFELDGAGEMHMFEHLLFPTTGDLDTPVQMISMGDLVSLATASGTQEQADHSFLVIEVRDADQKRVPGATIASDPAAPAGDICYAHGNPASLAVDCSATATTDMNGRAVLFDVPAGDLTVTASSGGSTFIPVLASTVIHTSVHP